MNDGLGVRAMREAKSSGMRSVNPKGNDRHRQGNLAKNPWSNTSRKTPSSQKATGIENQLRYALLRKGINFIEQASIGPWSIDFLLPDYMACVEADGEYWHSTTKAIMKDRRKDAWLRAKGYAVFHFDGKEIIQDADYCVQRMMKSLESSIAQMATQIQELEEDEDEDEFIETSLTPIDEYEQWLQKR